MPISALTKYGIHKESSWGSGGSPDYLLPVTPSSPSLIYENVLDNGLRGVAAKDFAAWQGAGHSEFKIDTFFYPELGGLFLSGIMGTYSSTASGTPVGTHTFKLGNTTNSYAITETNTVQDYMWPGLKIKEVDLKWSSAEGVLGLTADMVGNVKSSVTGTPVPTPCEAGGTPGTPFRGWQAGSVLVNGSSFTRLIGGEFKFARDVAVVFGSNNTVGPSNAYSGPLEVTATFTADWTADADYTLYTAKTQGIFEVYFTYGSGALLRTLKITCTNFDFGDGPVTIDRSGVNAIVGYSGRGLYNCTDLGPVAMILGNSWGGSPY